MSHNFPQNRDDIGVKIFPHEALVKRGDPNYYHYTPAVAVFGDKFEKKIDTSSVSPRVDVRRNDFNQSPISQQSVTKHVVYSNETSPAQANRHEVKQAIEEHLEHHERLEKLADFSVDLTPSPMVESDHLSFPHQQLHEQPAFQAPEPAVRHSHVADIVSEVEREEHEHEYERPPHEQEHDRDNGYENVTETHIMQQHSHEPELEIGDHHLQDILKKEYREELDKREEERRAEEYVQRHVDDQEYTGQNDHHAEHQHVTFDDPAREITEHQHVHSQVAESHNEEQHHVRHGSVDELVSEHRVQEGIEKFHEMEEQHQHQQEQRPIEHHQQTQPQQQHVHQDQHSMEHHVEHHAQKHGADVVVNRHVEEEVEPKEHHREFNSVRQMVQTVNENERKHKADGHSPEHHVQHHKEKQVTQGYQPRETTMELLHERHEVKLNIEVKREQQQSSTVRHETTYSEPKIIEFKRDVTAQHETTYGEPKPNTTYVESKQDMSPSRRIDIERPDIDSPTRIKTDAIIAQLKSVGVDSDGVKTLKDLKEEKKLAEIRKEAEIRAEVERIKREYTAEKFMNASPTHGGNTGVELPEWKRRMIAQKKADEAAKAEEERLWKEFDEWKNGQKPSWIKDVKQRKSQP